MTSSRHRPAIFRNLSRCVFALGASLATFACGDLRETPPAAIDAVSDGIVTPTPAGGATPPPVQPVQLGANFNVSGDEMNAYARAMMTDRRVTWTRSSLNVFKHFFAPGIVSSSQMAADVRIKNLKDAKAAGFSNVLTLKWDFLNYPRSTSSPTTTMPYVCRATDPNGESTSACQHDMPLATVADADPEMKRYLDWVSELLDAVGSSIDKLVVGNEPMWETRPADRVGESPRLVAFYRRLANRVGVWKANHPGHHFKVYLGSLNRLDRPENQGAPDVLGLFEAVNTMTEVDGIDLHLHQPDLPPTAGAPADAANTWTSYLAFVDTKLAATKGRIVTEWSPVWFYNAKKLEPLDACKSPGYGGLDGACDALLAWASSVNLSAKATNLDLFNYMRANRPPRVWNDFCDSRNWWGRDLIRDGYVLFSKHRVEVATYGMYGARHNGAFERTDAAWYLNPVFLDDLLPRQSANPAACDATSTSTDVVDKPCLPSGNRNYYNQFLSAQTGVYDRLL